MILASYGKGLMVALMSTDPHVSIAGALALGLGLSFKYLRKTTD